MQFAFQLFVSPRSEKCPLLSAVREGDLGIIWVGETDCSGLAAAWLESDISTICRHLLRAFAGNPIHIERQLTGLLSQFISHFIVYNTQTGEQRIISALSAAPLREISIHVAADEAKVAAKKIDLSIYSTEAESDSLLALTVQDPSGASAASSGVNITQTATSAPGSITLLRWRISSSWTSKAATSQLASRGGFEHANN